MKTRWSTDQDGGWPAVDCRLHVCSLPPATLNSGDRGERDRVKRDTHSQNVKGQVPVPACPFIVVHDRRPRLG